MSDFSKDRSAWHCEILGAVTQLGSMQQHASEDEIVCPHGGQALSEDQIRSILGQFGRAKWKKPQVSRFAKMTAAERKLASSNASKARWAKSREQSPLARF